MRRVLNIAAIIGLAWPAPAAAQPVKPPQLQQWLASLPPLKGAQWRKCFTAPQDVHGREPHPGPAYAFYQKRRAEYRLRPYFEFDGSPADPRFTCRQRAFASGGTLFHVQDIRYLTVGPNARVNKVRVCAERYVLPGRNGMTPVFFQGARVGFDGRGCHTRWTGPSS